MQGPVVSHRSRRRRGAFAALLASQLLVSACSSVYLHDEGLKTSTGKAHEALTGASPLKPFDDQLANLEAFAKREDLAVADYWAAVRDKHFNAALAYDSAERKSAMEEYIGIRLGQLLHPTYASDEGVLRQLALLPAKMAGKMEARQAAEERAASLGRNYLELWAKTQEAERERTGAGAGNRGEAPKKPDVGCAAVLKAPPPTFGAVSADLVAALRDRCDDVAKKDADLAQLREQLETWGRGAELGNAAADAEAVDEKTKVKLSDQGEEIAKAIRAAAEWDKTERATAKLASLRDDIRRLLRNATGEEAGAATALVGWQKAEETLDALLRAEICDAPKGVVEKTTYDEAKCEQVEAPTTTGRSQAGWAMLKALAQLQDANADTRRGANWVIAAKAIVAAEKADAALRLSEAKARAAASNQRLEALTTEAVALINARRWLEANSGEGQLSGFGDCEYDLPTPRPANEHCAFAFYVEAWNQGRLPAEMLRFRPIQLDREFGVRRSRAIAEKQFALASSGAATLKDYGEGGIMPEAVAQTVLDLATIGVIRLEK